MLRSRLKVLLDNVNTMYQSGTQVLEEDIAVAYSDAIATFMKSLDQSITSISVKIKEGMPADPLIYNVFTNAFMRDMEALFLEIGALDRLVTSSFNSIVAEREQVLQTSRRVSNKLGDYLLYADPSLGGGFFYGDSFNSPERIESGSSLVEGDECFLGQDEGVILLPLDGEPDRPKVKSYIVNQPSNGSEGNNLQLDVIGKDELAAIGDNEPNTWFEYEKVSAYESNEPLVLDLTMVLEEISVINHIHINPINFGTPTPVEISVLETSRDGAEYVSVKDEVPLKDFVSEEEEDVFSLSPATAKFAGQGFYSFLPRKAQYIHIVLQQHTPYAIKTSNGTRLRYAIGIRDINVMGRKFKSDGSIVSTPFSTGGDIRKVALWASENPVEASELADVLHGISENDGATWRPLQPQRRSGTEVPEVVNYNNISEGSISTSVPVTTLRHKVTMTRDPAAFEGDVVLKQEKLSQVDVVSMPVGGDPAFTTTQEPIEETIRIILPFYGSYSCPTARYGSTIAGESAPMDLDFMEFTVDVPPVDTLRFKLPFPALPNLIEHIRVFVNGEQVEYVSKDSDALGANSYTSYGPVDEDSKVYFLNRGGRELQFGYILNGDRKGFLPPTGARIQVCLDGDNPRLELTDAGYVLNLSTSSDGFKENTSIVSVDNLTEAEAVDYSITLPPGRTMFRVHDHIEGGAVSVLKTQAPSLPVSVGAPAVSADTKGPVEVALDTGLPLAVESESGAIPPIFLDKSNDTYLWEIEEYDNVGDLVTGINRKYTDQKDFKDGRQELMEFVGGIWQAIEGAYSFDAYSGTVYLWAATGTNRTTKFRCKRIKATVVPQDGWEYYRSSVHERLNTQKIVLDPKYVVSHKKSTEVAGGTTPVFSSQLLGDQESGHNWYKQRLVKGTVAISSDLFPIGTLPTEVPFIDGDLEFHSVVEIIDEPITFSGADEIYTFKLGKIDLDHKLSGSPGFAPLRSISNPNTPDSKFVQYITTTPVPSSTDGDWTYSVDDTTGEVTVTLKYDADMTSSANAHIVSYRYRADDPGVDIAGLYSIDYETGTIHFATLIEKTANIEFETSAYSCFYNIAEVIDDGDIEEVDEEGRKITLSAALGMKLLKLDTAAEARPSFAKISYEYYKKSTESLKDLEPYFSPICRDVALRAVTSDVLEEL
jgi:hypothetical protein